MSVGKQLAGGTEKVQGKHTSVSVVEYSYSHSSPSSLPFCSGASGNGAENKFCGGGVEWYASKLGGHSCSAIKVCDLDEDIFECVVREASGATKGDILHVYALGGQVGEFLMSQMMKLEIF